MNKYRSMATCLVFLMTFLMATGIGAAQTVKEVRDATDNLDITAIKMLQVGKSDGVGTYPATIHILVDNKNEHGIRLINGNFDIEFHDDRPNGDHLSIGKAPIKLEEINGNETKFVILSVPKISIEKIVRMINIIGNPENKLRMTLNGDSEVGLQVGRGWATEKGRKYTVELNWQPQVQREVLMK